MNALKIKRQNQLNDSFETAEAAHSQLTNQSHESHSEEENNQLRDMLNKRYGGKAESNLIVID